MLGSLLQQSQIPCVVLERLSREAFRRGAGAGLIEHRTVQLLDAHGLAESDSHSRRRERRVWMLTFLHASISRPNAPAPMTSLTSSGELAFRS